MSCLPDKWLTHNSWNFCCSFFFSWELYWVPASPGVFCSAHKGFHWQKGAWKLKLWCIFQVRESGRGCNTCRWQLEISHSLVVILSSCSWSNSQCLFMWFFDYLCFIRTFSVIPVVAIIPSGKMDPENVCSEWLVQFPLQHCNGAKDNMWSIRCRN